MTRSIISMSINHLLNKLDSQYIPSSSRVHHSPLRRGTDSSPRNRQPSANRPVFNPLTHLCSKIPQVESWQQRCCSKQIFSLFLLFFLITSSPPRITTTTKKTPSRCFFSVVMRVSSSDSSLLRKKKKRTKLC